MALLLIYGRISADSFEKQGNFLVDSLPELHFVFHLFHDVVYLVYVLFCVLFRINNTLSLNRRQFSNLHRCNFKLSCEVSMRSWILGKHRDYLVHPFLGDFFMVEFFVVGKKFGLDRLTLLDSDEAILTALVLIAQSDILLVGTVLLLIEPFIFEIFLV